MLNKYKYHRAHQRLLEAVHALAEGKGVVQERLFDVWKLFAGSLQDAEIPDEMKSVYSKLKQHGMIAGPAAILSIDDYEAVTMAKDIVEAYFAVGRLEHLEG